jgi:hypothetical protein
MTVSADPRQLFTARHDTHARFIRAVLYPQGLRSYFRIFNGLNGIKRMPDCPVKSLKIPKNPEPFRVGRT